MNIKEAAELVDELLLANQDPSDVMEGVIQGKWLEALTTLRDAVGPLREGPSLTQVIVVRIALKLAQEGYTLEERRGYQALKAFFEDVGYQVHKIDVGEPQ